MVWRYFHVYNENKFAKMHAYCVLCSSDVNYGVTHATTNLVKHIERHHKNEHKIIMHKQANERQYTAAGTDLITIILLVVLNLKSHSSSG